MLNKLMIFSSVAALTFIGCNSSPVPAYSYSTVVKRWPGGTGSLYFLDRFFIPGTDGSSDYYGATNLYTAPIQSDGKTNWNLPTLTSLDAFNPGEIPQGCSVTDKSFTQKIVHLDSDKGIIFVANKEPEAFANGYVSNQVLLISLIYVDRNVDITGTCSQRGDGSWIKSAINWKTGWNFVTVETDARAVESLTGFPIINDPKYKMDFYFVPNGANITVAGAGGLQYAGRKPKPFLPFLK
jgi:hypothetical protein